VVVTRRGRRKTVWARGAYSALLRGPSTSPLVDGSNERSRVTRFFDRSRASSLAELSANVADPGWVLCDDFSPRLVFAPKRIHFPALVPRLGHLHVASGAPRREGLLTWSQTVFWATVVPVLIWAALIAAVFGLAYALGAV
jgi:hypothetical protein